MKRTGYKEMLRDRCPDVVNMALLFCKCKTAWIEHVYANFIGIYPEIDARHEATRAILGIGKFKVFIFEKTIQWDNLDEEETEFWTNIKDWVEWFQKNMLLIEEEYYNNKTDVKWANLEIMQNTLAKRCGIDDKSCLKDLTEFLVNHLH